VIGHLVAYRRAIAIGDETVEIGMIGGVAHRARPSTARALPRAGRTHPRPFQATRHCRSRSCSPTSRASTPRAATARWRTRPASSIPTGAWKTFVHGGGMYAELADRRCPTCQSICAARRCRGNGGSVHRLPERKSHEITDVSLTLFAWDDIPPTQYGQMSRFSGSSALGCCGSAPTTASRGMRSWARRRTRRPPTGRG